MQSLKVLLADDHESFRRILAAFLNAQYGIEVVGTASDGIDAVALTDKLRPDIVLMDIHMPKKNGIEATVEIKNRWPSIKVFMLSMDPGEFYRRNAQLFADGLIAKTSMKSALLTVLDSEQQSHVGSFAGNVAAA
ncbi:MAG TPA: response regulator transcription factor [Bacteroidota bacterium]|nr:response regulator transcription factor [Bacteroidota bacterium]